MIFKHIAFALTVACLLTSLTAALTVPPYIAGYQKQEDRKSDEKKDKNPKKSENEPDLTTGPGIAILWEDPTDIESRDLFYGAGGQEGAPDPAGRFTFVRRSTSGTQEKIIIKDERGREWTVKFGPEARPETAATRIVWAVGYHVEHDYFVKRTRIEGRGGFDVWDVRFERRDYGFKEVGYWDWESNPFVGTRALEGLKTLMALLKSWDLKTENNNIARPDKGSGVGGKDIYYVADLGATFGATGSYLNKYPFLGELSPNRAPGPKRSKGKGDPESFRNERFIEGVRDGEVIFHVKHKRAISILKGVRVEHARWMGNLLARLSDKQLMDAFRAGGFNDSEVAIYVRIMRERIRQLQVLEESES